MYVFGSISLMINHSYFHIGNQDVMHIAADTEVEGTPYQIQPSVEVDLSS